ncbi:MAG: 1-acyl-sn-glycerol-3-phosphate acyltransferase [Kangiellaceae bacterium]
MAGEITIPVWLFLILLALASIVVVQKFLFPGIRWFFRKKINQAIIELNQKFNITLKPFQLTKRQVLLDRLIHDSEVLDFVQDQAKHDEVPRDVLMEKVQRYAREIVPSFNAYIYYRVGFWLSKKLALMLYKVQVKTASDQQLNQLDKDSTIVFVMNHRSNMDYILVSFLVSEKMTMSYAVGEWARVWPLQGLIKSMGAYFVRRNSRNPLYRKVLERYIDMATREGVCQAVFPEGGLTRDGELRPAKLGFMDYMLRNYDHNKHRDIVFIPVGINYDRVLEDKTLIRSLDPNAEQKSSWFAVKTSLKFWVRNIQLARRHQWKRFGYASVNFSEPISSKAYCLQHQVNFSSLKTQPRIDQVTRFAEYLMKQIEHSIPVVPLVTVACIASSMPADGMEKSAILKQARELNIKLENEGAKILFPNKDMLRNLEAALDMLCLRRLLEVKENRYFVTNEGASLLCYYRNSIAHRLSNK